MPEFVYKLSNGKELVLDGDIAPTDDEVESIAKEQGVSLALAEEEAPKTDFSNVKSGSSTIDPKVEMRRKLGYGRQDEQTFDLDKFLEGTNNLSNKISNKVGEQDWLPDFGKRTVATGMGLGVEGLNLAASLLADPTAAATSSTVMRSLSHKPNIPVPGPNIPIPEAALETIVPPVSKPRVRMKLDENGKNIGYEPIPNIPPPISLDPNLNQGIGDPELAGSVPYPIKKDAPVSEFHRQQLKSFGYGDETINKMTPEQAFHEITEELKVNEDIISGKLISEETKAKSKAILNKTTITIGGKTVDISGMEDKSALEALGIVKSQTPPIGTNPIIAQRIEKQATIELQSHGVPSPLATVAAQVTTKAPELAPVIKDPNFIRKYLTARIEKKTAVNNRETKGSRLRAGLGSSIDTELVNQNPRLGELVKQTQTDSHIKAGGWIADYDNLTEPLSDTQFSQLVEAIENKAKPTDDKVIAALVEYKKLDRAIQEEATATNMGLKSSDGSKTVPWVGRDNYWPHMYTEEFFKSLSRGNPTDIVAQMTKAGKSPQEIQDILSNSKKFGERLIDAQHAREADLPGYRTDRNVYRQHIADMSKRIVESKNYGPMDLVEDTSPLMELIKQTKNPEYSHKLMSKLLGRGGVGNSDTIDFSRKVVGAQAWLHLTTAGISNLNSFAMTPIQTTVKHFVGGLADTIFQAKQSGEFAKRSGAIQNIFREIFASSIDDTDKFRPTQLYGIDAGERFMRTVSANAGKRYVNELFHEMKDGNPNLMNLKKLQELTLTNPADLSLQTELNPQQISRAAFRVGELSQGLAEMQNLPEHWTGSGIANILTLFHKYQFAQTKVVKDLVTTGSVKQNIRNASMLLAASQVAGEITGDVKAGIRGTIRAGYSQDENALYEEIANRGDFAAKKFGLDDSPLLARFIENMFQSFALGIYADLADGFAGGGMDVLKQLAGSAVNDVMKVIDITKDLTEGDFGGAAIKGTSMIPLIGPPIAAEMRENQ